MINQTGDGFADAYSEGEAKEYEAKGWARYVAPVVVETPAVAEEAQEAPKKRGRPAKAS